MTDTYNTLEQAQMKKLSNAAEKGDKIFLKVFSRRLVMGRGYGIGVAYIGRGFGISK